VLAAVPREIAIYREINSYKELLQAAIHGSPDATNVHELHAKALALVTGNGASLKEKIHFDLEKAANRGLLLAEVAAIREAARLGRVERLYIANVPRADEELINSAALAVIRNSGSVIFGEPANRIGVAAVLRYRTGVNPAPAPVLAA
jgi:hypothetical protein